VQDASAAGWLAGYALLLVLGAALVFALAWQRAGPAEEEPAAEQGER
jgi:hypothetical protein